MSKEFLAKASAYAVAGISVITATVSSAHAAVFDLTGSNVTGLENGAAEQTQSYMNVIIKGWPILASLLGLGLFMSLIMPWFKKR